MAPRSHMLFFFAIATLLWLYPAISGAESRLLTVTLDESETTQVTLRRLDVAFEVNGERLAYRLVCPESTLQLPLKEHTALWSIFLKRYGPRVTAQDSLVDLLRATKHGNGLAFFWCGEGRPGEVEAHYSVKITAAEQARDYIDCPQPYPDVIVRSISAGLQITSDLYLPRDESPLEEPWKDAPIDLTRPNTAFSPKGSPSTSKPSQPRTPEDAYTWSRIRKARGDVISVDNTPGDCLLLGRYSGPVSETRMKAYNAVKVEWATGK